MSRKKAKATDETALPGVAAKGRVDDAPRPRAPEARVASTILRELGSLTYQTWQLSRGFAPLVKLLAHEKDVAREELAQALDTAFAGLYAHPVTRSAERVTQYLRARKLIPNEQSTEELIRFVVEQLVQRSPVPVPDALVREFWKFFGELFGSKELKGLGEMTLDMVRLVLRSYEPLLVEIVNLLKTGRRFNQWQLQELMRRAATIREDSVIVRRQIRALRFIKPFFQTDSKDFKAQAKIVAQMVREFGPFFVKMAQVAAANTDFLPEEIARELAVFHEDVPPMSESEVVQAFLECHGKLPTELYMGFDAARPVKSGSIGSVYVAKKPFLENGVEVLRPVVIKVGRHNIDREFVIGKLVLGLAILSSQYWAPHSKLAPFLRALVEQVDEFVAGFTQELDFDEEARSHRRFARRSLSSRSWRVPELYSGTRRILEMEYLSDAKSLLQALRHLPREARRRFQRQVSGNLLYTIVSHIFRYREIHGDLHPGNIMIGSDQSLYLIDWGNTVPLDGKWPVVRDYLTGAIRADVDLLADALIRISTQPEVNAARRAAIKATLRETLRKKKVGPLTVGVFLRELKSGVMKTLRRRGQAVLHLMTNTQQAGIVLQRDYVHLSRGVMAAVGSFNSLYENDPRKLLLHDLAKGALQLPLRYTAELAKAGFSALRARAARLLPVPRSLRARWSPAADIAQVAAEGGEPRILPALSSLPA
jgi:predicted unusual protein kinase regulating ubiquinone biosynthesis (AarF/ABC1/UbiB family)